MKAISKKLATPCILLPSSSLPYSTFNSGSGRGRGRGFAPPPPPPPPTSPPATESQDPPPLPPIGHGRGAGPTTNSSSPSFGRGIGRSSPIENPNPNTPISFAHGLGRGNGPPDVNPNPQLNPNAKQPTFFTKEQSMSQFADPNEKPEPPLPSKQPVPAVVGAGRGKAPLGRPEPAPETNRHARPRQPIGVPAASTAGPTVKLDREEAIRKAVEVLSRGGGGRGGGRGRGMTMRGRGRGGGGRGGRGRRDPDDDIELYVGDNADGEKFVKRMGEDRMKLVEEVFDEVTAEVLPSPVEEAYLEALHTNNLVIFYVWLAISY